MESAPTNALALRQNSPQTQKNLGDAYLKFQFGQQTPAVLSMNRAQEVVILPPSRLTPMPNVTAPVLGLMNRRSRVLWVVDLARLLGLPPIEINVQQYNVVIIRRESASLGLIVQTVEGVMRLSRDRIQSPLGQVSSRLVPYLRGCVLQEKEILLVLDGEAIMRSPLLHNA